MNPADAARLLSVAEHEVLDTRLRDGCWEALHHDMASHEETWRPLPFVVREFGVDVFAQPYADPGDDEPLVSEDEPEKTAPARPKRRPRS